MGSDGLTSIHNCFPITADTMATLPLVDTDTDDLTCECLVTTGATAAFPELIKSALSHPSLQALVNNGFTHITYQCGESLSLFEKWKPNITYDLVLKAFDFDKEGMSKNIARCKAKEGISKTGLVISHAGAGTILETLRYGIPMIVVPNKSLLDNHQEELADELDKQGYATKSTIKGLPKAIWKACLEEPKAWASNSASLAPIIDDVVGYEDETDAHLN